MPTAAKLFAAFAFGLVGFFAAEVMKPSFPEGMNLGWFSVICGLIGILVGWWVMGPNAGKGTGRAIGTGLRTSATIVFWALVFFSIYEMLARSVDKRYVGVMDALRGMVGLVVEYGAMVGTSTMTLAVLIVGGSLAGLFSEWAAKRWS
ncbi:MAG: TrgA family protein [Rhodobacteraceae bacterium]|jgi:hypothetical protein|nr:TrgA family protein [Paracoccaceae bacterium]